MRITPINTNQYKPSKHNERSHPTFGVWDKGSVARTKKAIQSGEVYHFTTLFRNPDFWASFSSHVQRKFPNGVKLHNYAAADGSESYSIALRLIEDLGEEKANKYFPIYSNDLSKVAIDRMKKREIEITKLEEESIFINLKKTSISEYFDFKGKDPNYGNDILKVKKNLYSKILPKRADIMKDLDDNSKFQEPCVLLFRNAWYFFTEDGKNKLAEKLFKTLKPGSSVIIGGVDKPQIPPILIQKGFKPVVRYGEDQLFIFERP